MIEEPPVFKKTKRQFEAMELLRSTHTALHILLYGGSRSGKTFLFIRAMIIRAIKCPESRHLALRLRFNRAKIGLWYDTIPKVFKLCFPEYSYKENKSDWFIEFMNGSQLWIGGLDDKERTEKLLGTEYSTILFNECSEMTYDSVTTVLTRLAQDNELVNKAYYDNNPPSIAHWSYKLFFLLIDPESREQMEAELYITMQMNPTDNLENLPDNYITGILDKLPSRKRKRFRDGEYTTDNPSALWQRAWIESNRVHKHPDLQRIVVAIDPAVSSAGNEHGIVVAGEVKTDTGFKYYILDDISLAGTPLEWGTVAVVAYHKYRADCIIGEKNNGGDLVKSNLLQVDPNVPVKLVWASRGKYVRAEPISTLYENNMVHHIGTFPDLENELCDWDPSKNYSPNRLDALVWCLTELAGEKFEWMNIGPDGVEQEGMSEFGEVMSEMMVRRKLGL